LTQLLKIRFDLAFEHPHRPANPPQRRTAAALPQAAWQPATQTRWRDGTEVTE
jgi:hypothetical protein